MVKGIAAGVTLAVVLAGGGCEMYNVNPGHRCDGHEGVTTNHRGHDYTCQGTPPKWTRTS